MKPTTSCTVLVAVALCAPRAIVAAECTAPQRDYYEDLIQAQPTKCGLQLGSFKVCDDDCLAGYTKTLENAPDCDTGMFGLTLGKTAKINVDACTSARTNSTGKYMPQATNGLPNCTTTQTEAWDKSHGLMSDYGDCEYSTDKCTDQCVKVLEEGVSSAPPCADPAGYWMGESKKPALVKCLNARKELLSSNKVLNSVVGGDGSQATNQTASIETDEPKESSPVPSVSAATTSPPVTTAAPVASVAATTVGSVVCAVTAVAIAVLL